ncbi:MAG: hypothetical protein NC452_09965 [Eubacterium sp.]|nr:hypothetical protein [Eubacterium sp.]
MMINGIGGVRVSGVRARSSGGVKNDSFGDVLKQTSAKDTFNSTSSVKRTPIKTAVSSVPDTQAKLDKISEAIKNTDYSGMSKIEIYADIEGKYADAFDDFYSTFVAWPSEDHVMIHHQFLDDTIGNDCYSISLSDKLEARGYSNMDYDEIEAVIKEKYAGKTGFADQLNLFGELYSSGIIIHKFGWEAAADMVSKLTPSIEIEYNGGERMSKNEWLSRIEEMGVSSPFSLLLNNPYFAKDKELFQSMVDDILFGIVDKNNRT